MKIWPQKIAIVLLFPLLFSIPAMSLGPNEPQQDSPTYDDIVGPPSQSAVIICQRLIHEGLYKSTRQNKPTEPFHGQTKLQTYYKAGNAHHIK